MEMDNHLLLLACKILKITLSYPHHIVGLRFRHELKFYFILDTSSKLFVSYFMCYLSTCARFVRRKVVLFWFFFLPASSRQYP